MRGDQIERWSIKIAILLCLAWAPIVTPANGNSAEFSSVPDSLEFPQLLLPTVWCLRGDGMACQQYELNDPVHFRQILVLPTGYAFSEYADFRKDFEILVAAMSRPGGAIYSGAYLKKILYVGHWVAGGALGSPDAAFGGRIASHPVRGKALTLRQNEVIRSVDLLRETIFPQSDPLGVMVLFNAVPEEPVTANASPPSFLGKPYGIAKMTRRDLREPYISTHEMAHAALNFLDEYIERGLENMNISSLDILTPLAILDASWGNWIEAGMNLLSVYTYKISEILASNGNENVDVTRYPSRVITPGYSPNEFEKEGGMFFGRGTFHDRGRNLMGSFALADPDDGFAYDHSGAQRSLVQQVFETPFIASRANDRIRNAGPASSWPANFGSDVRVLLFDGDKNHRFHPTQRYDVQVGWYERHWRACFWGPFPYPCYDSVWTTAQRSSIPDQRNIHLRTTQLYGLAAVVQQVICLLGAGEIPSGGQRFNLCQMSLEEMTSAFLPTLIFSMPYQEISVPTTQWFTTYHWRFRTDNASVTSGWTSWSAFQRTF